MTGYICIRFRVGTRSADFVRAPASEALRAELVAALRALPEDLAPVHLLLDELAAGKLAVTAFTSASQVENVFTVAADAGLGAELAGWLNQRTITAAIGPTCAQALEQRGVRVVIQPQRPKMVPLVHAIRDHVAR